MSSSNEAATPQSTSISYEQLTQSWPAFEAQILALLETIGLADKALVCDHVALRVNSIASADALRDAFSHVGKIISDNIINGRTILIIELDTPLTLGQFSIACVELPYPSDKVYPQEGWEHIELVIDSKATECDTLSQDLLALCPKLSALLPSEQAAEPVLPSSPDLSSQGIASLAGIKIKMSSPKGDKERLANPTIAFKRDDVCIKVHPHGIKAVIASEQT
ncbi:VOC family protein [Shewanella baltica]|uniref:VOC family protein n=1 Tax=Shewanella baltica TaxID=62322 RepID=UPI00217D389B|nr:VOC family protein [Shewanella baltica]MCS6126248.1 VOC family protein [Shewanella baltica]MCS6138390.1 VOC family protein [Shewanella baltica]MCS6144258.1 VOC family protein [Shewanella baltica]MCS6168786.1 VOC family protein [Shewanella baltica]MCS6186240.1 VOC family protein [Shewanella baltica]